MPSRFATPILAGMLLAACVCRCGAPEDSGGAAPLTTPPVAGGTLVIGGYSDIGNWNEYLTGATFDLNVLRRIYLRLADPAPGETNEPEDYVPSLAESWAFSDDGLALTFRLRPATWSDGTALTAADVRFTWQAQTSADVPWFGAVTKSLIRDVQVVDERTVTFQFERSHVYALADAVEGGILPEHVFGAVPFAEWVHHDWSAVSVGSGPFLIADYRPQEQITLERNPRYWREGFPLLDRVVIRIVPDAASLVTQLRTGDVQLVDGVAPRDAAGFADEPSLVVHRIDQGYTYLGWNGARPPFDRSAVRHALTVATDRRALVDDLLYGFGRIGRGPIRSTQWAADPTIEPWPYDPERARRELAGHGYGDANPLRFRVLTNTGNALREATLVKLQDQFSRVGVQVKVESLEGRAFRQRVLAGDYDAYVGGWVFAGKIDVESLFASWALPPAGNNVVSYRSEDADAWLRKIDAATTRDELKAGYDGLQQRIHQDQPYTFLFENARILAHRREVGGVVVRTPGDPWLGLEEYWLAPR